MKNLKKKFYCLLIKIINQLAIMHIYTRILLNIKSKMSDFKPIQPGVKVKNSTICESNKKLVKF